MITILMTRLHHQLLKFVQVLLLLIIVSGCSRNRDISRPAAVTQIHFKENMITLDVGSSARLMVLHSPSELTAPGYEWAVANSGVARVENGVVYGYQVGETEVSVVAKELGLTAKIKIRVLPILPQSLRLQAEKTSLLVGEETPVTYTVHPQDVTDIDKLEIEWSSSDETVCTISDNKILALGAGSADVVASIKGTDITGKLTIQVALVPIESVSLNLLQTTVSVGIGVRLIPQILPAHATDKRLVWTSENPEVASVVDGTVLGRKEGMTTIRVTSADGQKTATCQVTVKPIQVQRIILSTTTLSLTVDQEYLANATVLPEDAKDKSLRWNSSNTSIITVDQQGKIVAKGKGEAIIWAISNSNPNIQAGCQVLVTKPEEMIFTQVTAGSKVTVDGYMSATVSGLFMNGYYVPVKLISFEVLSHAGEVIIGNYKGPIISPSIQYTHTVTIKNVYKPFVRYVFEFSGRRYERLVEIS
ncbi:Ig-like domain-containing protein [Pedobacter ginsengisoli]|uniref:Ig-like domain-containing protein n=1 Tax=Pedobacter ginsengisoli TaxID=363852 RepID=UPI00254D22EC|nr:Ig-like domain-containing protein [Pedobacter ginsengisoli]